MHTEKGMPAVHVKAEGLGVLSITLDYLFPIVFNHDRWVALNL